KRTLARGIGPCVAVTRVVHLCRPGERRDPYPAASQRSNTGGRSAFVTLSGGYGSRLALRLAGTTRIYASNTMTLRTVLPAFMAGKPSLIFRRLHIAAN